MTASGPLLRSVLYVPGANERALEKARSLPADAVILDLEDSVAPDTKLEARSRVSALLRADAYAGRPAAVRINAVGTPWHQGDLEAVASVRPDAVLVPKLQTGDEVLEIERALRGLADSKTSIWAMLETPLAVLRALEIATASERLDVLVIGTNDLLAELRAELVPGRGPLETSLALCLLAARAAGRRILDGVFNDLRDAEGLAAECRAARRLGFDGKTLIHPAQIEICNRVFSPSQIELEHARRVIDAYDQAVRAGRGVATLDGRLVEGLHVDAARRVLMAAECDEPST